MHYLKYLLLFFGLLSCKPSSQKIFSQVINDTFLDMVDTFAYKYHSFFLNPADSTPPNRPTGFNICYIEKLEQTKGAIDFLRGEIEKRRKIHFLSLLDSRYYDSIETFPAAEIKNHGKYHFVTKDHCDGLDSTYIGLIQFGKPFLNDSLGIVFLRIFSEPRAGKLTSYLVRKGTDGWRIEDEIEFARY